MFIQPVSSFFFANDCLFLACSLVVRCVVDERKKKEIIKQKRQKSFLMLYNEMNEQRMLNAWGNFV